MQQPKMIVLGLIAQGYRYGFEMERYIDNSKMRQWARIGKSTIYKALRDLLETGDVTDKKEIAERGPGKVVFSLTKSGKKKLVEQVREALASRESVYSDRIAGLVFASGLPRKVALEELQNGITGIGFALDRVAAEREKVKESATARIVLNFYQKVYQAEKDAMIEMKDLL